MNRYDLVISATSNKPLRSRIKKFIVSLGAKNTKQAEKVSASVRSTIAGCDKKKKQLKKKQQQAFNKSKAKRAKQAESYRKKYKRR